MRQRDSWTYVRLPKCQMNFILQCSASPTKQVFFLATNETAFATQLQKTLTGFITPLIAQDLCETLQRSQILFQMQNFITTNC